MTSGVWLPLLGPFFWAQNKSFTVHIERARAIACRRSRCLGLRALKNAYRCSRWLVGEPMTSGVWLPLLGSFFLGTKKRFHCAHRARAGNCLQALTLLGLQALKKAYRCSRRLVREPIASGVWLPRLGCFFLRTKKRFHCAQRAIACRGSCRRLLRAQKSAYRCSRRLVRKPATSGVWLPRLGCFFSRTKKRFHCALRTRAGNCLQAFALLVAAGPKKSLPTTKMTISLLGITCNRIALTGGVHRAGCKMPLPVHHAACKQSVCSLIIMHTENLSSGLKNAHESRCR